jgi:Xaa-Pro aminopeptidase
VFHATGYEVPLLAARHSADAGACAVLPRDPGQPVALIMPAPIYYARHAQLHAPEAAQDGGVIAFLYEDAAGEPAIYRDRGLAPLDPLERVRAQATRREIARRPPQATAQAALERALRQLGVAGGRVGFDHSQPVTVAELRAVKSAAEIARLRIAQRNTSEAALVAARAARAGAGYGELRAVFNAEVARRGGSGVWMVVDRAITDAWDGRLRDGQVFYIDCVSQYGGYHGDYGRTVSLGEPPAVMRRTTAAIHAAWEAIRARLRPGISYGDIQATGQAALRAVDGELGVRITPHSVGLQHTDLPFAAERVLEAGMVLSIDCPVIDTGIGGSAHREDLVLITGDGCELLNAPGEEVIVV